jgi:predicted dinucleotide-binding enzyme
VTTLGIIGAGHIGGAIAHTAIQHGYDVVIANSRGPETLADLVAELGPRARAGTAAEAAAAADLAVVTIPFRAYRDVPVEPLAGKVVIDTNNYYAQRDGQFPEIDAGTATSSGLLQAHLPTSHVVKAFNHIRADLIAADATPAGTPDRRALTIAGDDPTALDTVAAFIDEIGFDTVRIPLAESWRIEPGTPAYSAALTAERLRDTLATTTR